MVGLEARFGPWQSLQAFRERLLGVGQAFSLPSSAGRLETCPTKPHHWWGIPESDWFRAADLPGAPFAGYYLGGSLSVPIDSFRIPPRELQEMLPQQILMLQAAAAALARAPVPPERRPRTGVYLGMGIDLNTTNFHFRWWVLKQGRAWALQQGGQPGSADVERWVRALADAASPPLTANRTMGALASIAASRIAREFHLGGPSFTLCGEENSGLRALEAAVRALQRGEIDQGLAGAVDLAGDVRAVLARGRPSERTAIGEGAAAVVLKRLADAVADGDTIHAVIKGIGTAGGGDGDGPDEGACREALGRACREAGIDSALGRSLPEESARADVGDAGAASGLASFVKACLRLAPQARAAVSSRGTDGTCTQVILEGGEGRSAVSDGAAAPRGPVVEVPICGRPFVLPRFVRQQDKNDPLKRQIAQAVTTAGATAQAHAAYLRFSQTLDCGVSDSLKFQTSLLEAFVASGGRRVRCADAPSAIPPDPTPAVRAADPTAHTLRSPFTLDRAQCLEFAVGSIGRVLGPAFAAIDSHPTRVRLPDEPLMLVDRILTV